MNVAVAGLRAAIALALIVTGAVGLQSGLTCQYDWAVIGAAILMLAWAARWLLSAASLGLSIPAARVSRPRELLYTIGLAAAALLFAGQSLSESWWPFGWWPLVVGVLLASVAVVCARDFARAS